VNNINTLLSATVRSSRQNTTIKKHQMLNATIDKMYLRELYRVFYPPDAEFPLFIASL
jgi:hypothetical protein